MYRSALLDMNFGIYSYLSVAILLLSSYFLFKNLIKVESYGMYSGISLMITVININQCAIFADELNWRGTSKLIFILILEILIFILTLIKSDSLSKK